MLAHYLTTALRLLWRERGYAAINVFGLALGFSLCLLIIQFTSYQLAVGTFHENGDRVYRVLGPAMARRRVQHESAHSHGPDPRGATAPGGGSGPLPREVADAAPARRQGGALRLRADRGGRRPPGLRLPPAARRPGDGP